MSKSIITGGYSTAETVSFDLFAYIGSLTHFTISKMENKGYLENKEAYYIDTLFFYSTNDKRQVQRTYEIRLTLNSHNEIVNEIHSSRYNKQNIIRRLGDLDENLDAIPIRYVASYFRSFSLVLITPKKGQEYRHPFYAKMILCSYKDLANKITQILLNGVEIKKYITEEIPLSDEDFDEPEIDYPDDFTSVRYMNPEDYGPSD